MGSAVGVAIILAGLICLPIGLCYAELSGMFPHAGTAYTYTKYAMGDLPAFVVGWTLYTPFGMVALAIAWSDYFQSLFSNSSITSNSHISIWLAVTIAALMTGIASREIRLSDRLATILLCINILVVFIFLTLSVPHIKLEYWGASLSWGAVFQNSNLLVATASVFYAYTGFETAAALAQDSVAPQKDVPYAIKTSLLVAGVMYFLVGMGLTGILPANEIETIAPLSKALTSIGHSWAANLIDGAIVSTVSCVLLTTLLRQCRLGYAMANDNHYSLQKSRGISLHKTTLFTGGMVIAVLLLFPGLSATDAVQVFCLAVLFGFSIVCLDLIVLRVKRPDLHRPFVTPLGTTIAVIGMVTCLALMYKLPSKAWNWFFSWMAIGLVVFWIKQRIVVITESSQMKPRKITW